MIGDDRYLAVTITEGTDSRNRLWLYPLDDVDGRTVLGDPIKIIDEAVAEMLPIELVDGRLYLETDLDAPRGRVVWTDPRQPLGEDGRPELTEVYRPGEDTLLAIEAVGRGHGRGHPGRREPGGPGAGVGRDRTPSPAADRWFPGRAERSRR